MQFSIFTYNLIHNIYQNLQYNILKFIFFFLYNISINYYKLLQIITFYK